MRKEIEELSVSFASLVKKTKEIKGDGMESDQQSQMMDNICAMCDNLSRRIDYLSNSLWDYSYQHSKGHLPPIKTSNQMEKALKAIGMEGDYDVQKPTIYVSASKRNGLQITASFEKKK